MSKGYTLNYFIDVFNNTPTTLVSKQGVYCTVSPRFGIFSEKANALDRWLDGDTRAIAGGVGRFAKYGKTPRARMLKALRNRKSKGSV